MDIIMEISNHQDQTHSYQLTTTYMVSNSFVVKFTPPYEAV
jgi:hypothetical protein